MFIANKNSGITEIKEIAGLQQLKNYSFTFAFGSELSTSGRLMPQYFLKQAEVHLKDFQGEDRPQCKRTLRG